MSGIEIPIIIFNTVAHIALIVTLFMTWTRGYTPTFAPYLFWVFNISGMFFVAIGFKEQIMSLARTGGFLIFVSYFLLANLMFDQIDKQRSNEKEKNGKKK